jgi:hypothetical protein
MKYIENLEYNVSNDIASSIINTCGPGNSQTMDVFIGSMKGCGNTNFTGQPRSVVYLGCAGLFDGTDKFRDITVTKSMLSNVMNNNIEKLRTVLENSNNAELKQIPQTDEYKLLKNIINNNFVLTQLQNYINRKKNKYTKQ